MDLDAELRQQPKGLLGADLEAEAVGRAPRDPLRSEGPAVVEEALFRDAPALEQVGERQPGLDGGLRLADAPSEEFAAVDVLDGDHERPGHPAVREAYEDVPLVAVDVHQLQGVEGVDAALLRRQDVPERVLALPPEGDDPGIDLALQLALEGLHVGLVTPAADRGSLDHAGVAGGQSGLFGAQIIALEVGPCVGVDLGLGAAALTPRRQPREAVNHRDAGDQATPIPEGRGADAGARRDLSHRGGRGVAGLLQSLDIADRRQAALRFVLNFVRLPVEPGPKAVLRRGRWAMHSDAFRCIGDQAALD